MGEQQIVIDLFLILNGLCRQKNIDLFLRSNFESLPDCIGKDLGKINFNVESSKQPRHYLKESLEKMGCDTNSNDQDMINYMNKIASAIFVLIRDLGDPEFENLMLKIFENVPQRIAEMES